MGADYWQQQQLEEEEYYYEQRLQENGNSAKRSIRSGDRQISNKHNAKIQVSWNRRRYERNVPYFISQQFINSAVFARY
jgi:hypothetical protein